MTTINPYLNFNGTCEEAFNLYKEVFGGEFSYTARFKEMPPEMAEKVPEAEQNNIMHISLPISKETVLMGSDSSEAFGKTVTQGDNYSICINADSMKHADEIFEKFADGGKPLMPMSKTFWNAYYGMVVDKFGIYCMIMSDLK